MNLHMQHRGLSKAINYLSKSVSKNTRRQTEGIDTRINNSWSLRLHWGGLSCPPRVNSKSGLFHPLSSLHYALASFLAEAKQTFINFSIAYHNLGSSRAMPSHLEGFTSKSNKCVTPDFKAKTRGSSYVCPGLRCHTYGQNVNIENQCLKFISFIIRILSLHRRLYWHSRRAVAEQANPIGNRPGQHKLLEEIFIIEVHLISDFWAALQQGWVDLLLLLSKWRRKYNNIYAGSKQN
jgi:hypothetical protein